MSEALQLSSSQGAVASCHQRLTLHCSFTSSKNISVRHFSWYQHSSGAELCCDGDGCNRTESQHVHCDYARQSLSLTIRHVGLRDQGNYTCKVRTNYGTEHTVSTVTVSECNGKFHHSHRWHGNQVELNCSISGVHPAGGIHWFHGNENLTQEATSHRVTQGQDGTYLVSSSLIHTPSLSTYNCSRWLDSRGAYVASQVISVPIIGSARKMHSPTGRAETHGTAWRGLPLILAALILH